MIVRRYAGHASSMDNFFLREHGPRQMHSAPEPASRTRPRRILPTSMSHIPADPAILWGCFPRRVSIEWAERLIEGCPILGPWAGLVTSPGNGYAYMSYRFLIPILGPGNGVLEVVDNWMATGGGLSVQEGRLLNPYST